MESSRHRERKRYCCFYCNTYFYQVDSWQRHNRKHTGVEIECDDCGQMCSDHFELKEHQRSCESYQVYSQEFFSHAPGNVTGHGRSSGNGRIKENISVHETPDSTSKQESTPESENIASTTPCGDANAHQESNSEPESPEDGKELSVNPELEHLIGEDKEQTGNHDEADPETEALIGIDQREVSKMEKSERSLKSSENGIGVNSQIIINVENALNSTKANLGESSDEKHVSSYLNQASPVGSSVMTQGISLDGSEMSKKYQPYFCKNCGARFTRKDSVTRHLKKGTCSGKSAIVCNICGKVFSEMFELQEHFKVDHKNVVFTPTVVHRSILPRNDNNETQPPYTHYPTHYIVHDQHMVHVSRPYHQHEQSYRPMPPGLQTMFYGGQSSFGPRPVHPPAAAPYEQIIPARPLELKYSQTNHVSKDLSYINNPGKILVARSEEVSRKREYPDVPHHVQHNSDTHKSRKIEMEHHRGKPYLHSPKYVMEKSSGHESINLSEYTNNAMNSKQYYNNRFTKKEPSTGKDEPPRAHQCKVCGLEFPRFEYLLTHLRKHKEKNEVEPFDEHHKDRSKTPLNNEAPKISSLNDYNSSSSDDNDHVMKPNFVMSQSQEKGPIIHSSNHEAMPIVIPQPHYGAHIPLNDRHLVSHDQMYVPQHAQHASQLEGAPVEAITPGVDGKFRPFICENCGQRFTRKDSLVRHAKKQTCFEEASDLKCKNCDKTFRYHKCLTQHQELVHGIPQEEQKHGSDEDLSESESEKNDGDELNNVRHEDDRKYKEEFQYRNFHRADDKPMAKSDQYHSPASSSEPFPYENHTVMQTKPTVQPSTPQLIPPKSEEKVKPPDPANKNQDSNYIGYCMLPRPFQCEYCGDRFAHRHSLKRHVRRHLGIGIPCHDCGKLYRDQSEWRRHQRSIHNRHYEKYEVPNRMSFRDSVDQGLIGIVPNSNEFENHDEELSGSENDEEDVSMIEVDEAKSNTDDQSNAGTSFSNHLTSFGFLKKPSNDSALAKTEPATVVSKDEKLKPFNFKSHLTGDKDSRKSVLDSYLCSSNSDDGDGEKNSHDQPKSVV